MKLKSEIMDEAAVYRSMLRITHEIIEKNNGVENLVLLGIRRRGVPLAALLRDNLLRFEELGLELHHSRIYQEHNREQCTTCRRVFQELKIPNY